MKRPSSANGGGAVLKRPSRALTGCAPSFEPVPSSLVTRDDGTGSNDLVVPASELEVVDMIH